MLSDPKVSVVMAAYNAAAYLDEAVSSILDQTFRDFEFLVINNGSSDDTAAILDRYERIDRRIHVNYHEQQGLAPALNYGCRLSRGEYVALMDADDVSCPTRLERQLEYIEGHPEIGIVGTWICKVDKDGSVTGTWYPPTNPKLLKWTNFFGVCVASPTVLIRRDLLKKLDFFRPDLLHAEDVDLWLRASRITQFGNVPEVLYKYRVWTGSNTQVNRHLVRDTHVRLLAAFIKDFLKVEPPIQAVAGLRQTRVGPSFDNRNQIHLTAALIERLYQNFIRENALTSEERREISWDAAKRIASLAFQASLFDTAEFMSLFIRALKLDYRLLYPSAIIRGLQRRWSFINEEWLRKRTDVGPRLARGG